MTHIPPAYAAEHELSVWRARRRLFHAMMVNSGYSAIGGSFFKALIERSGDLNENLVVLWTAIGIGLLLGALIWPDADS